MSQYHRFIKIGDEIHAAYEYQRAFKSPDALLAASKQENLAPGTYFVGEVLCTTGSVSIYFDGENVYVPKLDEWRAKYYQFDSKYLECDFFWAGAPIGEIMP